MCSETVPEASHLPGEEGVWLFVIGVMVMFTALFAIFFHYARSIRPSSRARTGRSIKGWA